MKNKKQENVSIVFIDKPKQNIKENIKNFLTDYLEPIYNLISCWFSIKEYTKVGLVAIYPFKMILGIIIIPILFFLYLLFTICYCIVIGLFLLLGFIVVEIIEDKLWKLLLKIKKIFYK